MPMYKYKCEKCGGSTEVIRSFIEYEVPPDEEEFPTKEGEDTCTHEWGRVIGIPGVTFKGNWSGKGNW